MYFLAYNFQSSSLANRWRALLVQTETACNKIMTFLIENGSVIR